MAIGTAFSDFRPMLHDYYSGEKALVRAIDRLPTLRLLRKSTDWKGRDYVRPVHYEKPQNVGKQISTVLADKANHRARQDAWTYTTKDIYGVATLDRKTMKMSEGNARSFLSHYTAEVDGTMKTMMEDLATNIFRTQAVARSTVDTSHASTSLATGVVGLASKWDTVHFKVGMDVVFSDAGSAPGASLHTPSSGRATVGTINRTLGTISITNGVGGSAVDLTSDMSTAIDNGDFIHRRGDVSATSNTLGLCGFEDFILSAADRASPGTFKGVDRSLDVDRLAGLQLSASGYSMRNALLEMLVLASNANVELSHAVMHGSRFAQLVRECEATVIRDDKEGSAKIGRRMIKVQLEADEISVYSDPYCQTDKIWGLQVKDLDLKSVGKLPGFLDDDLLMLRDSGADGYEVRLGGYGELTWSYPGNHIHVELS